MKKNKGQFLIIALAFSVLLVVLFLKYLKTNKTELKMEEITVIDVRTAEEFSGGNVAGSINIPLNEISNRIDEIKAIQTKIVLCCASGGRSGMAEGMLKDLGVDCVNGGSWLDVNYQVNNN